MEAEPPAVYPPLGVAVWQQVPVSVPLQQSTSIQQPPGALMPAAPGIVPVDYTAASGDLVQPVQFVAATAELVPKQKAPSRAGSSGTLCEHGKRRSSMAV